MIRMAGLAVALMVITVIICPSIYGKEFSDHHEIKVQRLLKQLNKPALKSIKSEDGDIIDCVPITIQPAFDHPMLKNHTIQMRPSYIPDGDSAYTKKKAKAVTQMWQKSGQCPQNTVPIRRTKKEDILRAKSIENFGKKSPPSIPEVTSSDRVFRHEYAYMGVRNEKFYGTKASINIWKPEVEDPSEFSLAQVWLVSGAGLTRNTIEVGWQVYPQIYKDNNPRLFVYWTSDGYQKTGCYNLCSGFVQTNNQYSVGASYTSASQYDGGQLDLNILVWKDQKTGNWWLKINENDVMGYWPGSLFNSLGDGATKVEWGGEIYTHSGVRHTTTDMGSGHFAEEGYKKASYIKNIKVVDGTNNLREPEGLYSSADNNGNCYNVKAGDAGTTFGVHFFFGGPGQNVKCP
ncbi:Protein neprosin [Cardamine amara subsp. amara]|uniref:Protein neprosin n=1 Tax=Cardamine amara subsp. amara TaxID=228776 RepID=A0ABD1AVP4_CARAN